MNTSWFQKLQRHKITRITQTLLLKMCTGLMLLAFVYLLMALLLGILEIHADRDREMKGDVVIYLMSNGVHTDIVMPMKNRVYDWHKVVNPKHTQVGEPAEYVGMGWGDRGFYLEAKTWDNLSPVTAVKAISGLGGTAMHVTFYAQAPAEDPDTIPVKLTAAEYERLIEGILPSFRFDPDSLKPIHIPNAFYHESDAFYEATGRYTLFNTCNTWANERLKKSGLKAVIWTPFSGSLMNAYRQNH